MAGHPAKDSMHASSMELIVDGAQMLLMEQNHQKHGVMSMGFQVNFSDSIKGSPGLA